MSEYDYYDTELSCSSYYILPAIQKLLRDLPPEAVIVDLGCGNGSLLAQLRGHGWELHGIEMSQSGLEQASKNFPDIHFSHADLTTDLASHPLTARCDAVISTEVVEHVFFPRIYAKNCHRFLKPGGRLIISTPYHGYCKNVMLAVMNKMDGHYSALWDYGHIKFWSQKTLTLLLEETGFAVTQFLGVGRVPLLWKSMILMARRP